MSNSSWNWPAEWDADRLYVLFFRFRESIITRAEDEEFCRLLRILITARFHKLGYYISLPQVRLAPEDVEQEVLLTLRRRLKAVMFKWPCPKTLLSWCHTGIWHAACTQVQGALSPKRKLMMSMTDYKASDRREELGPVAPAEFRLPDLDALLLSEDAEDEGCRGVPASNAFALSAAYKHLARAFVRTNEVPTFTDLPMKLKAKYVAKSSLTIYQPCAGPGEG